MNIATVRHLPIPEGESNHTLPYNNGVSLHVGPVRVLGGCAEAEIKTIRVLCVGAIGRTELRTELRTAAGCCQIYAHSLVSVDRLPSRARAGRARIAVFWHKNGSLAAGGRPSEPIKCLIKLLDEGN